MGNKRPVTVLGAGYTGLTTAAELTLRGFKVNVVAADLGYRPPLTIVGTQVSNFFNLTKFFVKLISRKNSFFFSLAGGQDLLLVTRPLTMMIF